MEKMCALQRFLESIFQRGRATTKEKADLTSHVEEMLAAKVTLERELTEKKKIVESLEIEIVDMENCIGQMNASIESLKSELVEVLSGGQEFLA